MQAIPVWGLAQGGAYTIKGKIGNLNAPATIFLVYNNSVADRAVLKNGEFAFNGSVPQPTEAYLMINPTGKSAPTNNYAHFYLESGTITVSSAGNLTKATITGTLNNNSLTRYDALMKPLEERDDKLEAEDTNATDAQKRSPTFLKNLELANKKLQKEKDAANKKFILENPSSLVSLFALYNLAQYNDYATVASLYEKLSPAVKNNPTGQAYAQTLEKMKLTGIGSIAPDFMLPDTAGRMVKLSSFKGKYVLLDFWASWCPICREAAPGVVKAYETYRGKNFNILSVSLDKPTDRQKWLQAIRHDGLKWTQVSDLKFWSSPVVSLYKLTALPSNFLIDPSGKIIARDLDSDELAAKLAVIFGKGS